MPHHPFKFMVLTLSITYLMDKVMNRLFNYWDERNRQARSRNLETMLRLLQLAEFRGQLHNSSVFNNTSDHTSHGTTSGKWHLEASTPNGTASLNSSRTSTPDAQVPPSTDGVKTQFQKDYEEMCIRLQNHSIQEENENYAD